LQAMGVQDPGAAYVPEEIFGVDALLSLKGLAILIVGGFLVGFGARYAGGCTSGHAISGLSNLQIPSLIAVIGFFIGGLTMTYLVLPIILPL
ncbi:MAG: YeeE/YedE thiosulfate transporter family protein, partial [Bacteroidota bacterium]